MAFVVLFSTMSFTVDMHYCGGVLVDTAIFHKVKSCGMDMQKPSTEGCSKVKKNCCSDEQIVLDSQDELQLNIDKITLEQRVFIASFVYSYITLFEGLDTDISLFEEYDPPVVIRQLYKIDETYLI
ncbi:MAG: hypothetical protein KC469_04465 [Flavobacteriaceae bacterium]|nr:hypothetical protein [Flavobacteriaceae bacterium]